MILVPACHDTSVNIKDGICDPGSILEKHSYPEIPPRVEYELTQFGHKFIKIIDQIELLQAE